MCFTACRASRRSTTHQPSGRRRQNQHHPPPWKERYSTPDPMTTVSLSKSSIPASPAVWRPGPIPKHWPAWCRTDRCRVRSTASRCRLGTQSLSRMTVGRPWRPSTPSRNPISKPQPGIKKPPGWWSARRTVVSGWWRQQCLWRLPGHLSQRQDGQGVVHPGHGTGGSP